METTCKSTTGAKLYAILVRVMYSFKNERTHRDWIVRVVAPDGDHAMRAAIIYAERQRDTSIRPDAKSFSESASIIDSLGSVDCIGESLRS